MAAGGGDRGARVRAYSGARLPGPGHVPGRAGDEESGAGGAAASALTPAALGSAAAPPAAAPGPGEPAGGPGPGRRGGAGVPCTCLMSPTCGLRGRRRGPASWSSHLEGPCGPATEPLPRLPSCRRGRREPGCPLPPTGSPRAGCRTPLARPFPELVTSARRGPGSPARRGPRGRVCEGPTTRNRAAWPSHGRPPTRPSGARGAGPKGSGGFGEPGRAGCLAAGRPGGGRGPGPLDRGHCFWGKSPAPGKAETRRLSSRRTVLFLENLLASLGV